MQTFSYHILLKRINQFSSPFPKSYQRYNDERKRNPRKSIHSTQFPNETHSIEKNEMIEKIFVKCKHKCFSINKQSGK